ncbi:unnamed protein product [Mytilus edulis]|uniref:C-type lectin domain-containing protein n=1 Tax=Mytilus edulis TaxID=6550 RepID=A0A8S3S829_MYTED|nr:unnamed protein product [Mytilus edulis]
MSKKHKCIKNWNFYVRKTFSEYNAEHLCIITDYVDSTSVVNTVMSKMFSKYVEQWQGNLQSEKALSDFNLTFYNESKTWSEAKEFCYVNGGILETDETIIIKDHDYTKDNVKLWLGAYSLITPWSGVFENTKTRSAINAYNASKFCEDEDSFLRWNPLVSCNNSDESFDQKHWTSIKRSQQIFRLTAYDENLTLKPLQCIGLDTYGDLYTFAKQSAVNCTELRPFYCRYGSRPLINSASNESPGHNVTMELPDDSHITRYLIPGAIAGTTLLAIIVGVVIFVFRRRSTERKADVRQDVQRSNNAEQIGHGKNLNRYSYSEVKVEDSNQHVNMIDNGDDQYTTGTSDVYDHLNENKNRKIKTENPHAIYDHAIGDNAESDYDSTKHVVPTNLDYQEVRIGSEEESLALN